MNTKVAIISILLKNRNSVQELNALLHEYADYIIGRMGIPYKAKSINIMSIAIDAPETKINELSNKISTLKDITTKVVYADM